MPSKGCGRTTTARRSCTGSTICSPPRPRGASAATRISSAADRFERVRGPPPHPWHSAARGTTIEGMTEQNLPATISLLSRTPAVLDALLRDLPEAWTRSTEGPGSWSPFDIVGHLLHGERTDWMPRIRTILEAGDARAFEPFDRFAQQRE